MDLTDRRSPRYVVVLAVAACLILIVGWLVRPREIPHSPPPVPSETELQELARRTQRRSLEEMTAYFADLAASVRGSLAYVPSAGTSGVIWDETHVVTGPMSVVRHIGAVSVRTASGQQVAEATASQRLPLSVLAIPAAQLSTTIVRRAASLPQTGDWLVAVWQTDREPAFAATNFRQSAATTCGLVQVRELVSSATLEPGMIGGGLFNMDRDLVGVILPCGDHVAAIEPASIDDLLKRAAAVEERLLTLYGVLFSTISQDEQRYFTDSDGLLVREVWVGSDGEAAGLRPGDVIVRLNDQSVGTLEDLRPLTTRSDVPVELRVRRGAREETITLASSSALRLSSDTGDAGMILESSAQPYRIESVLPGSRAARAGVKPGDRLVRINRAEPRSRAQVVRALTAEASAPIMLEIERGARRIAIIIPESSSR